MILSPRHWIARRVIEDRHQPSGESRADLLHRFFVSGGGIQHTSSRRQVDIVRDDRKVRGLIGQNEVALHQVDRLVEERICQAESNEHDWSRCEQGPDDFARERS